MKTNVEISEWLKAQVWYSNFVNNFTNDTWNVNESLESDFLSGNLEENTILEAFNWADSSEGYEFWNNVNSTFLDFLEV